MSSRCRIFNHRVERASYSVDPLVKGLSEPESRVVSRIKYAATVIGLTAAGSVIGLAGHSYTEGERSSSVQEAPLKAVQGAAAAGLVVGIVAGGLRYVAEDNEKFSYSAAVYNRLLLPETECPLDLSEVVKVSDDHFPDQCKTALQREVFENNLRRYLPNTFDARFMSTELILEGFHNDISNIRSELDTLNQVLAEAGLNPTTDDLADPLYKESSFIPLLSDYLDVVAPLAQEQTWLDFIRS